ncbi:MAG TPA: ABC transporter ATP-binding protein [Syntrophomonadaceae bacterium]|nr:ABC transporter ATP-binding protein [Syntrophomonadaceae bacterium]
MAGIKVCNVSKTLQNLFTLDDISLRVDCSEFAVILGPSGCGKSTLLNIISGLIPPDQGSVELGGVNWTGRTGRISYMQQKDLLLPHKNVLDNVCIPLLLKGSKKKDAHSLARQYLRDFGLEGFENHYPRQLSGGMRQRAALLRTYLFTSDIMLLDEPFAGLDAITRRKMQLWLKDLCKNYQPSVLFVTHDIDEALLLADTVYVFSNRPAKVQLRIRVPESIQGDPAFLIKQKSDILAMLEVL